MTQIVGSAAMRSSGAVAAKMEYSYQVAPSAPWFAPHTLQVDYECETSPCVSRQSQVILPFDAYGNPAGVINLTDATAPFNHVVGTAAAPATPVTAPAGSAPGGSAPGGSAPPPSVSRSRARGRRPAPGTNDAKLR